MLAVADDDAAPRGHQMRSSLFLAITVFAVSCTDPDSRDARITITQPNDLGVVTLEATHVQDDGNSVFTLQGLSAAGGEIASVQLTIGVIADLSQVVPGNNYGSQIVMSFGDRHIRSVTRETRMFRLPAVADQNIQAFVDLAQVSALLAGENIFIAAAGPATGVENAFDTYDCNLGDINTTPVAGQCCEYSTDCDSRSCADEVFIGTMFQRYSDDAVISRTKNPYGTACTADDGKSSCNGSNCFYGPNGFARTVITAGDAATIIYEYIAGPRAYPNCNYANNGISGSYEGNGDQLSVQYPDASGTFGPGQGCPGSSSGDGDWDY
jgi:hypothetical protein